MSMGESMERVTGWECGPERKIKTYAFNNPDETTGREACEFFFYGKKYKTLSWNQELFISSEISTDPQYGWGYRDCIACVFVGENSEGEQVSFITHQADPGFDVSLLEAKIKEFMRQVKPGTVDAVIVGGRISVSGDEAHAEFNADDVRHYKEQVAAAAGVVESSLGFRPRIAAEPMFLYLSFTPRGAAKPIRDTSGSQQVLFRTPTRGLVVSRTCNKIPMQEQQRLYALLQKQLGKGE